MNELRTRLERFFPCPFERGHSLLVIIGIVSALVYVYTRIGFKNDMRDLPQNLMVITFLISAWSHRHRLWSDLVFRLLILAVVIPWVLFGINALIDYETAVEYRSTNDLLKLFLFLPLAWWIGGSRAGAIRMLILAFLGLLTAVAMDPNLVDSLQRLWARQRVDFGIHNAQHGAMFFGLVVIYCVCSLGARFRDTPMLNRVNGLLLVTGLAALIGLLGTKTRAAILGLFVAGMVAVLLLLWKGQLFDRGRLSMAKALIIPVLVAGILIWPATVLVNRMSVELPVFNALLSGDLESVPFTSLGIRLHSWVEALEWIAERPVTGWGQDARSDVIQLSERFPDEIKAMGFGHLHNGYLEILLGFGIVGFVFLAVLWVVVLRRTRLAASPDLFHFALYSSIFFFVINLSESFFIYSSGEFAVAVFLAGGYSLYLGKTLASGSPTNETPDSR